MPIPWKGYAPQPGTVVEGLSSDLKWDLCVVANEYLTVDEDKDDETITVMTTLTLNSKRRGDLEHGNDPDEVRPPKAAVHAVWGEAPVYWMQYQLLQAEKQSK